MKRAIVGVCLLVLWSMAIAEDDASGLLDRSAAAYAAMKTYRDHGTVESPSDGTIDFDTSFARPGSLRFTWVSHHPFVLLNHLKLTSSVRADGTDVHFRRETYEHKVTDERSPSLALAIAGATGVSRGAAHHTATLLLPDLWKDEPFGAAVLAMREPHLIGEEAIDGVPCLRVEGVDRRGGRMALWIGTRDRLIRRIDTSAGDLQWTEWHRGIEVDGPMPAATFSQPPVAASSSGR